VAFFACVGVYARYVRGLEPPPQAKPNSRLRSGKKKRRQE
jgi:hypothetical protein